MGILIRWRGSGPQQVAHPDPTIKKLTDAAISARLADARRRRELWIGKGRQTRLHCLQRCLIQQGGKRPGEILAAFHQLGGSPVEAFITFQLFFKLLRVGAAHLAIYPCHDSVVVIGRCKTVRVQERFSFTGAVRQRTWQAEPAPSPAGSSRYR